MAPSSASVAVGNSVVFAVNASGGVAGDAASWTCASSNTGIATVSVVSAGCQADGRHGRRGDGHGGGKQEWRDGERGRPAHRDVR